MIYSLLQIGDDKCIDRIELILSGWIGQRIVYTHLGWLGAYWNLACQICLYG